jgi:aminopeptidase-like protein
VSGEIAKKHVEEISRFHRIRGGGPGYHASALYIQNALREYGYADIELEGFLADGFTYYLGWPTPVGSRVEAAELWLLEPEKELLARFSDVAVSLMPYSNGGHAVGTVIDVGGGERDEDYEGIDVRGKIVLATGSGSTVHRKAVIERGALCILVTPSGRADRQDYPDLIEMQRLSPRGEEVDKTTFGFSLSERQSRRIRQWLAEGKEVKVEANVDAELFDGEMEVLTTAMKGSLFPEQEIILIAHLDHYRPGAGDNATGSASNLEIARALKRLIEREAIPPPKRSIRIMWVPEFHGTMAYLAKHPELGRKGLAALNMDMTGQDQYKTRSLMAYRRPPLSSPSYVGDVVENMLRYVDTADIHSARGSRQFFNYRVGDYSGGSDHVPLTDPSIGVPAVMLGFSPDRFHHTSEDTVDKVDPTSLKRVTLVAMASVLFMANADDEEALRLAGEVAGQGLGRLGRMTKKNVNDLYETLTDSDEDSFHERFKHALTYTEVAGEVEMSAIRSCQDFATQESVLSAIEQLATSIEANVESEIQKIEQYYESLCSIHDLQPKAPTLTALEKKAQQIVPTRKFRGIMDRSSVMGSMVAKSKGEIWSSKGTNGRDLLAGYEEDERWYQEHAEKMGGLRTVIRSHIFELSNLIDGKRSVLDIRNALSAEFGETDLEFVMKYISDLKRFNLVTY